MARRVAVVGGGISRFDLPRYELHEELAAEAVRELLTKTRNFNLGDLDAAFYSYFSDHLAQQLCFHWIVHDYLGLLPKPAFRVESGGATPVDAIINAYTYVRAGLYDLVLVVGWEKMSELDTPKVNEFIAMASDTDWDFPVGGYYTGYYAVLESRHMHLYGETEEDLAKLAVKNHNNATYNPYAQWRSQHGTGLINTEDVFRSRLIAWPYRVLNCALISDGASCILLASGEVAKKLTDSPVWITGVGLGTDTMRPGDRIDNPGYRRSIQRTKRPTREFQPNRVHHTQRWPTSGPSGLPQTSRTRWLDSVTRSSNLTLLSSSTLTMESSCVPTRISASASEGRERAS